ncbi:MAG: hypothetical protein IAE67_07105 [Candidatus Competibacteraceae bacterium]|nr:hypothetical protein [Candidatus Competibacteraceae bacterium]
MDFYIFLNEKEGDIDCHGAWSVYEYENDDTLHHLSDESPFCFDNYSHELHMFEAMRHASARKASFAFQ